MTRDIAPIEADIAFAHDQMQPWRDMLRDPSKELDATPERGAPVFSTPVIHRLPVDEFTGRFEPGEYQRSGAGWDEVERHPAFLEQNPFNPNRIHAGTWFEFVADVAANGVREPVEVDPYDGTVCEGHHRVMAALLTGAEIPFVMSEYPPGHPSHTA